MKIKNAVVLAGGKGTRLKSVVKDIPKPMAPINDRPFLELVLDFLYDYEIKNIVLSVGYAKEVIKEHFKDNYRGMKIRYAEENEPLGTGGGIRLASRFFKNEPFFVFNGDTLFFADLWKMEEAYFSHEVDMVMALKPMEKFERYGTVDLDKGKNIQSFNEKKYCEKGLINGGVYLFDNSLFLIDDYKTSFSFEKDVLEKYVGQLKIKGVILDSYFIDIGIPEDYFKCIGDKKEQKINQLIEKIKKEKGWTLFLDRDGVINKRIPGNYVRFPDEFEFMKGSDDAIAKFSKVFDRIVVVTNQQGVGKKLMNVQMKSMILC